MLSELDRLCEKLHIRIASVYGAVEVPEGWAPGTHPYKVTLYKSGRQLTTPFFMGPLNEREPTTADVLSCLMSDANSSELSFEEFCSDFGYDSDSRKAEETWKSCVKIAPRLRRFLGDDFDAVANAEH